ncbi:MAG TPA: heme lyase CcmF/NrfE family subunit [Pseudomonadales bacterium]
MLAEIAHFLLILSLCLALLLAVAPMTGSLIHDRSLMASGRPLSLALFLLTATSFVMLVLLFLRDDFSVRLVMQHSNRLLPDVYKVTASWGNHEGSMLLWVLVLNGWTAAVALFSRSIPLDMQARVLSVMGMIAVGFLLFLLLTSNPFERLLPNVPLDGRDLNPLLQDVGMIVHPPMLYMGYVGFSVAFAFAVAGLLGGEFDAAWVRWTRPWTAAAWGFLTLGIALGSWWAYYELGWGGWWFWDPVENASFMPWLAGTALLHSLAVTEQRGIFKSWTILLAIFTFSLSLLGTFLVRSGVLTSVHAFAADPDRGLFILAFLGLVVGGSLTLFALRAPLVVSRGRFAWMSREMFLLFNNIILLTATVTVLVGTLFPLFADVLELGKYSVGPPYFNATFVPLMLALLLVLPIGTLLHWKNTRSDRIRGMLVFMLPATVLLTAAFVGLSRSPFSLWTLASFALAAWLLVSMLLDLRHKLRHAGSLWLGLRRLSLSFYGMQLAHLGLLVTAVGIAVVSVNGEQLDIRMQPGDSHPLQDYRIVFDGSGNTRGANYDAQVGHFSVYRDQRLLVQLHPEKRRYFSQPGNVMTEAAIHARLSRDLFVALGEPLADGAWSVRLQYKPLVRWIWLGALLMACGALLAILDKRYRKS